MPRRRRHDAGLRHHLRQRQQGDGRGLRRRQPRRRRRLRRRPARSRRASPAATMPKADTEECTHRRREVPEAPGHLPRLQERERQRRPPRLLLPGRDDHRRTGRSPASRGRRARSPSTSATASRTRAVRRRRTTRSAAAGISRRRPWTRTASRRSTRRATAAATTPCATASSSTGATTATAATSPVRDAAHEPDLSASRPTSDGASGAPDVPRPGADREGRDQLRPVVRRRHVHGRHHAVGDAGAGASWPATSISSPAAARGLRRLLPARSAGPVPDQRQPGRARARSTMVGTARRCSATCGRTGSPTAFPSCKGDQYLFPPSVDAARRHVGHRHPGLVPQLLVHDRGALPVHLHAASRSSLQFYGDDDLFIFINGKLAVDLGGVHQRLPGQGVRSTPTAARRSIEGGSLDTDRRHQPVPAADPVTALIPNTLAQRRRQRPHATARAPPATAATARVDLGLTAGRTYEIAVFHADRHPTRVELPAHAERVHDQPVELLRPAAATASPPAPRSATAARRRRRPTPSCGGTTTTARTAAAPPSASTARTAATASVNGAGEECDLGSREEQRRPTATRTAARPAASARTSAATAGRRGQGEQCDLGRTTA